MLKADKPCKRYSFKKKKSLLGPESGVQMLLDLASKECPEKGKRNMGDCLFVEYIFKISGKFLKRLSSSS